MQRKYLTKLSLCLYTYIYNNNNKLCKLELEDNFFSPRIGIYKKPTASITFNSKTPQGKAALSCSILYYKILPKWGEKKETNYIHVSKEKVKSVLFTYDIEIPHSPKKNYQKIS